MPNIIIDPHHHKEDKANREVNQDLKFGSDTSLFKKDKLDYKDLEIRYIKIIMPDGKISFSELTPGIEKPRDKDGVRFEYCSKIDMLNHFGKLKYGIDGWDKVVNAYRSKKRLWKNMELELIRGTNVEKVLKK
jgi:hypothetical protein